MARVLIVDEDVVLRDFLKSSLKQEGFDVHTASKVSGVRRSDYDAVLADIERPFSLEKLEFRLRLMGLKQIA